MSDEIKVRFTGNTSNLKATVGQVKAEITSVGKEAERQKSVMAGLGKQVLGLASAYVSVGAVVSSVNAILDKFGRVQDSIDKSGFSAETLQQFILAADQSGASMESLTTASAKLSKAITFGDEADQSIQVLKDLGMSIDDLKKMSPDAVFAAVANSVASIKDPMQKSAVATALFGRAGKDLIPTFETIHEGVSSLVTLTAEEIKNLDDLGDGLTAVAANAEALGGKMLSSLVPALRAVANEIRSNPTLTRMLINSASLGLGSVVTGLVGGPAQLTDRQRMDAQSGHSAGDAIDYAQKIKDREAAAAESARHDKNARAMAVATADRLARIHALNAEHQKDEAAAAEQTSKNEAETAKIRHDAALNAMDDEGKLQSLIKERGDLLKKYTGKESALEKSEIDIQLAKLDAEITGLKKSILSNEAAGGEPPPPEPKQYPLGTLPSAKNLDQFNSDPANYNPDGTVKNPWLKRYFENRASLDAKHEAYRQGRMIGGKGIPAKSSPQNSLTAQDLADSAFPTSMLNPDGSVPKPGEKNFIGPTIKDIMGDGTKPKSDTAKPGGGGGGEKSFGDIYDILDKRLPKKSA